MKGSEARKGKRNLQDLLELSRDRRSPVDEKISNSSSQGKVEVKNAFNRNDLMRPTELL